jgi:hypothetical protein
VQVALALQKLEGRHPGGVMLQMLQTLHARRAYWAQLQEVVRGSDAAGDYRAGLPLEGPALDPEQQARVLIELATDPGVLGRAYAGWKPWV